MRKIGIFAFSVLAAACAGPGGLNAGDSFVIGADRSATTPESRLVVSVGGSRPAVVEVPVSMLTARVKWGPVNDGVLEALVIPLGNVDVSAARFPPDGLQLREVTLDLPAKAHGTGQRLTGDSMRLDVVAPMRLMMGLGLTDGGTYQLGPTQTAPIHIHVEAGPTSVGVKASCSGVCWRVGGVAEMSDAVADIVSPAEIID